MINFHGGTTEKITNQLDDLIKGKPEGLIVHVGTNDIANKVNIFNNVKKIFRKVSKDSSLTQLAFSSMIIRKDKNNFEKCIIEATKRLRNHYWERGLGYIENNGNKEVLDSGNGLSITPEKTNSDIYSTFENIQKNNSKKIIIADLNNHSIRNKLD